MKMWSGFVLLAAVAVSPLFINESFAAPACVCTLEWQASPDPGVAGYALYYGIAGMPLTNRLDVGMTTTAALKNLNSTWTYDFYVVAYDATKNESAPSNLLPYTAAAISSLAIGQPTGGSMQLSFHVAPGAKCHVEYTDSLNPPAWHVLSTAVADANGLVAINDPAAVAETRFYRASVP